MAEILMVAGTLYSGYSAYQSGQEQKDQYREQAAIARQEAETQATQKDTERRKTLAQQRMAYLANGVSISGTPLTVGEETSKEYQTEIDALRTSGANQYGSLMKQGASAANSGRTKLITSLFSSAGTAKKAKMF